MTNAQNTRILDRLLLVLSVWFLLLLGIHKKELGMFKMHWIRSPFFVFFPFLDYLVYSFSLHPFFSFFSSLLFGLFVLFGFVLLFLSESMINEFGFTSGATTTVLDTLKKGVAATKDDCYCAR